VKKELYFIGLGISPERDLSLGAISALKKCDTVLYHSFPQAEELLPSWGARAIEDIAPLYYDGGVDMENYLRIENHMFSLFQKYDRVGFATHGHPWMGVTLSSRCAKRSLKENISFQALPGVSSYDAMITDLQVDPLNRGCQILDANRVLLFRYPVNPSLDNFIYHVCAVGTSKTHYSDPSKDNSLIRLQNWLLEFYQPHREVCLIHSSTVPGQPSQVERFPINQLAAQLNRITYGTTLFIPGEFPKEYDREYLNLISPSQQARSTAVS
jgi:uncharacterized protein YabN with tetrapyrrole methylase and pyrophosphatase domain